MAALGLTAALTMPVMAEHDVPGPAVDPQEIAFPGGEPVCETGTGVRFGNEEGQPPLEAGSSAGGVTITAIDVDAGTLSFAADEGKLVSAVFMKGSDTQNLYDYSGFSGGGVAHDDGLVTPDNASGGPAGISHVDFCVVDAPAEEELSASLTIVKNADGDAGEEFAFGEESLANGESFDLLFETDAFTDGSVEATVTETLTADQVAALWSLDEITCDEGATFEVSGSSVTVTLSDGDEVTCTFFNVQGDEGTLGGNPTPTPAAEVPDTAIAPLVQLPAIAMSLASIVALATLMTLRLARRR
jgi:hypothetical protein